MTDKIIQSGSSSKAAAAVVPKRFTIGLAIFALILGLAGFVFRLIFGESLQQILPNLLVTGLIFWVLLPSGFMLGAKLLNQFSGRPPILMRNALTLGLLFSCVAMLWMMSVYS